MTFPFDLFPSVTSASLLRAFFSPSVPASEFSNASRCVRKNGRPVPEVILTLRAFI